MFERFTERARRTIFFARNEATQAGALNVEPAHLALAIMREVPDLFRELMSGEERFNELAEALRKHHIGTEAISQLVDLPMSLESQRALRSTADLAGDNWITAEVVLLAVMEEDPPRATLESFGISGEALRVYIKTHPAAKFDMGKAAAGGRTVIRMEAPGPVSARVAPLMALSARVPPERRDAMERILRGMCEERVEISGSDSQGSFSFKFGESEATEQALSERS
jgi:hypothetical protein